MHVSSSIGDDPLSDFRALYRRHHGMIWHALHRFGVSPSLVDDALQDTFVVAYRRRAAFDGGSQRAWLYGIARRVASNYRRAAERRDRRGRAAAPPAHRPSDALPQAHEALRVLERFVEGLRPGDRELFLLSELEGMTGPEISDALGKNLHTTYSRIRKLRQGFAAEVADPRVLARARDERPRATARAWAVLLPSLRDAGGAARWLPTLSAPAWASAGASVAGVLVLAVLAGRPPDGPARASVASGSPAAPTIAASIESSGDELQITAAPAIEAALASAVGHPSERPEARPAPIIASATTRAPRARSSPPRADPSTTLAEENELLRRASQALQAGRAEAALALTDDHAQRYPHSALADLRAALRIESLCAVGRTSQARDEAATFLARPTGSPVRDRIRRACASQNSTAADNQGA